jgi:site-specific DNA recombinase
METEDQLTGEMKWKLMVQRFYGATEISADMVGAFVESIKLHKDGTLDIKLSYMDEFTSLIATNERLRKEVAA